MAATFQRHLDGAIKACFGRRIGDTHSIDKIGLSSCGRMMFFYELHKRMGCFPYSYFVDKDTADITFNTLEKRYDDHRAVSG